MSSALVAGFRRARTRGRLAARLVHEFGGGRLRAAGCWRGCETSSAGFGILAEVRQLAVGPRGLLRCYPAWTSGSRSVGEPDGRLRLCLCRSPKPAGDVQGPAVFLVNPQEAGGCDALAAADVGDVAKLLSSWLWYSSHRQAPLVAGFFAGGQQFVGQFVVAGEHAGCLMAQRDDAGAGQVARSMTVWVELFHVGEGVAQYNRSSASVLRISTVWLLRW